MKDDLEERAGRRVGTVLKGKYHLDAVLGVGGMGAVYRATHRNRARLAVKVLHADLCARPDVRARFLREAYAANSVDHPGVVRVVDDDVADDGSALLVMDLLEGATVEALWERAGQQLSVPVAAAIVHQLLDVLAAAHKAGVIHRDVKPANLFVTTDGTLKVLDFGIARVLEADAAESRRGVPIGTPTFMAPEQAAAKSASIGVATDVWAAGATLFTLVSGKTVHDAATAQALLVSAAMDPARSLAEVAPDIPALVVGVVDRALAFEPAMRWPTAAAMRDALAEACKLGYGAMLPKASLAALVGEASGKVQVAPGDLASAPTIQAAEPVEPRGEPTSVPISLTGASSPPTRAARWLWMALGLSAAIGAAVALRAWRRPAVTSVPVVVPTASASPRPTGAPLVFLLGVENRTNDPELDGTVDGLLEYELLNSPILYPYGGSGLRGLLSGTGDATAAVDQRASRSYAERADRPVTTVRGAVSPDGSGYLLSITAADALSGAVLATLQRRAAAPGQVAGAVALLATDLRSALHDVPVAPTSTPYGSSSLEADHELFVGRADAQSGHPDQAQRHLKTAVDLDPGFALAHSWLAVADHNVGRDQEALESIEKALEQVERLPERQRLNVRALRALLNDDNRDAIAIYEAVLKKWPADNTVRTNLAAAYAEAGDDARSLEIGREAASLTQRWIARVNVVTFEVNAGDFARAAADAQRLVVDFPNAKGKAYDLGAAAQALLGNRADARALLERLTAIDPSLGARATADLAMFEGRLDDAAATLKAGISADEAAGRSEAAMLKWALLAELTARASGREAAVDPARRAAHSRDPFTLFLSGRVLAYAGRREEASGFQTSLGRFTHGRGAFLARALAAVMELANGQSKDAIETLSRVRVGRQGLIVCDDLSRGLLSNRRFEDAERLLEECWTKRGAAATAPLDDEVTLFVLPPMRYDLAVAKDGLHQPDAADAYRSFLAMEPEAQKDDMANKAKNRLAVLTASAGGAVDP